MDRRELRRRIASRPNSVRFEELQRLLEVYGWTVIRIRGSHHTFQRGGDRYVIPRRTPQMLPDYVRGVLDRTEED